MRPVPPEWFLFFTIVEPNPYTLISFLELSALARTMDSMDHVYNRITAGNDKTDGIVQGASQIYPNAIRNVSAANPASHAGETKTEGSATEVREIMAGDLGVVRRTQQ